MLLAHVECGLNLMYRNTMDLVDMPGLKEQVYHFANASSLQ